MMFFSKQYSKIVSDHSGDDENHYKDAHWQQIVDTRILLRGNSLTYASVIVGD